MEVEMLQVATAVVTLISLLAYVALIVLVILKVSYKVGLIYDIASPSTSKL